MHAFLFHPLYIMWWEWVADVLCLILSSGGLLEAMERGNDLCLLSKCLCGAGGRQQRGILSHSLSHSHPPPLLSLSIPPQYSLPFSPLMMGVDIVDGRTGDRRQAG